MAGRSLPLLFLLLFVAAAEASTSRNGQCGSSNIVFKKPNITSVEPGLVRVSFVEWTEEKGLGFKQSERGLSYLLILQGARNTEEKEVSNETCSISSTEKLYSCNVTDLTPDTPYTVKVLKRTRKGTLICNETSGSEGFTTLCPDPPVPQGLSAFNRSSDSFAVQWTAVTYPEECGPRYWIAVYNKIEDSIQRFYQRRENKAQHLVTGLQADTEYILEVLTSNEDHKNSSATNITVRTALPPDVELYVKRIKTRNATMSWLTVSWHTPRKFIASIAFYKVTLRSSLPAGATAADCQPRNKTVYIEEAEAQFDCLDADEEYVVQVAACSTERCWTAKEGNVYTNPPKPSFKNETVAVQGEPAGSTVVIVLPVLDNPPGWHYVVMQRQVAGSPTQDEAAQKLMDEALALVKGDVEGEDTDPPPDDVDGSLYITAVVKQEGNERLQVTLGDNKIYGNYTNLPLKSQTAYNLTVVTEKRKGDRHEWSVAPPVKILTTADVHAGGALMVLAGLVAAVALVMTAVILCLRKKRRRRPTFRGRHTQPSPRTSPKAEQAVRHSKIPYNNTDLKSSAGMASQTSQSRPSTSHDLTVRYSKLEHVSIPFKPFADIPHQASQNLPEKDIFANKTVMIYKDDLEAYLLRAVMSKDTEQEFVGIPPFILKSTSVSDLPVNCTKNRLQGIVTYDETRVTLPLHDNIPHTDYINASFIEGSGRRAAFIATQGPTAETVGAFWRMVWHTQSPAVVMVACTTERGKEAVAQYWPETEPLVAEGVTVTPEGITKTMDFVARTFRLTVGRVSREVTQYQYTAWSDGGVPHMAYGLAHMLKKVRRNHGGRLPITVHCSEGVGRTGVVVLVLFLLEQLEVHGTVSFAKALQTLIRCRGNIVQNVEHYVFAHQVLHEMLFGRDTSIPCPSFGKQLAALHSTQTPDGVSPLQHQFEKLRSLPKDLSFKHGKDPKRAHLNRNQDIVPADCRSVFVQGPDFIRNDPYLNVVRVNGADVKDAFLAGEHPLPHTLAKMWRLVHERQVGAWVLVHSFPHDNQEFPPVVCESSALEDVTLAASQPRSLSHYDEQEVDVSRHATEVSTHRCVLLTLKGWPADQGLPDSHEPLLSVIERAVAIAGNQQILITCKDGVTGCGVVAALLVAIGRTRLTQEVDIYRAVASVTQDRPQFIVDQEQYDFLYLAMEAFLSSEGHCDNFR